ncbi:MAG TPA: SDR family oxidoreductase, partial [Pseudomonadales bacterium]|nr:SDR family oxidoreductase [Pseudomonadales bacterium]
MPQPLTALITGASSGIGLELAKLFAKDGHGLVLVARRENALEQLAQTLRTQHNVAVDVIAMDLAVSGAAEKLVAEINVRNRQIDVLVNNAGFGTNGNFAESPLSGWQQMMQLNMVTLTELTHLLLPGMRERRFGKILNISSVAGLQSCPNFAVYAATKAYVLWLSEALREELAGEGISVTTVCPGATATDFHRVANNENSLFTKMMDSVDRVARDA